MTKAKQTAYIGVLAALALILSYLESLIPVFVATPGVKLGLANLVTLAALYRLSVPAAICVSVTRVILSTLLFGNPVGLMYSLAGACLSLIVMIILKWTKVFGITGVSVAGAVSHNVGQLAVAAVLLDNKVLFAYLPVLVFFGLAAGVLIGLLAAWLISKIR